MAEVLLPTRPMTTLEALTRNHPAPTAENITYTWDTTVGGNREIGRIAKIDEQSGSIEWTYNSRGQVTQEKKIISSAVYTVGYTYARRQRHPDIHLSLRANSLAMPEASPVL